MGISLDGTRETHDAFRLSAAGEPAYDRVPDNIRLLRKNQIEYNALCVVTQAVAEQSAHVFEALRERRYLQFIPCLDGLDDTAGPFSLNSCTYGQFLIDTFALYERYFHTRDHVSVRNFDSLLHMLLESPPENCAMAGKRGKYCLIEADGGVYPCDFYVLDPWRMGTSRKSPFSIMTGQTSPPGSVLNRIRFLRNAYSANGFPCAAGEVDGTGNP